MLLLERHVWRLGSRVDALGDVLRQYENVNLARVDLFDIERIIIQLQIEWEYFVRAVILDSATGRYSSKSGPVSSTLPVKFSNREHVGFVLIKQYKKRRTEPDWYLPQEAIAAAGKLAITNEITISAELGVSPWELDDLRHLRNFIAHRSARSATSMRGIGTVAKAERIVPSSICFDFQVGGLRRYEGWIAFMKGVGGRLVA